MPRANSSVPRHRRHRKIVKQAKGYYGARSRTFKSAKDAVVKAGLYAYRDRRQRKRQRRRQRRRPEDQHHVSSYALPHMSYL